jgi:hypothetical protein
MQGLISNISSFDFSFPQLIEGATELEIRELESLVRLPLPKDYQEFLRHFGKKDGRLRIGSDSSTNIEEATVSGLVMSVVRKLLRELKEFSGSLDVPRDGSRSRASASVGTTRSRTGCFSGLQRAPQNENPMEISG